MARQRSAIRDRLTAPVAPICGDRGWKDKNVPLTPSTGVDGTVLPLRNHSTKHLPKALAESLVHFFQPCPHHPCPSPWFQQLSRCGQHPHYVSNYIAGRWAGIDCARADRAVAMATPPQEHKATPWP